MAGKNNTYLKNAITHFKPRLETPRAIDIPEWAKEGEEPVFYVTSLSLKERQKLRFQYEDDPILLSVTVVIKKLKDKEGNPVFDVGDKQALLCKVDPSVIARVAQEILEDNVDIEEAEKN